MHALSSRHYEHSHMSLCTAGRTAQKSSYDDNSMCSNLGRIQDGGAVPHYFWGEEMAGLHVVLPLMPRKAAAAVDKSKNWTARMRMLQECKLCHP